MDYYRIIADAGSIFTFDSILIGLIFPTAGAYFISVGASPFVATDTGGYELYGYSITASDPPSNGPVPEPATFTLAGIAGLGLMGARWSRRRKAAIAV